MTLGLAAVANGNAKGGLKTTFGRVMVNLRAPVKKGVEVISQHWLGVALAGYIALSMAGAGWIHFKRVPKGSFMNWTEVKDGFEVKAKPDGIWTLAYEYVRAPALVEIEANDDEWEYAPGKKCSANGDLSSTLRPQDAILTTAPVGALIAKVGGSTAGISDGRLFVVGKKALLQLDQNTSGPLFLTINDQLSGLQNNDKSIKVKISIVYVPQVSSAASVPLIPQAPVTTSVSGAPIAGAPIAGAPVPNK
ncbi:MAG TPA: hypothetical protein VJO16_07990 [Candidatus Acidoferrum sp.]|nr:hypothetical protein [Candidatus Acidoferrum sp.]